MQNYLIHLLRIVPALRIGDIVSLRNADLGGFLFTEGILVEDIGVADENDLESFEDALFHIQPQHQYSAFRECKEFEEMFVTDKEPDKKTLLLHNMLKVRSLNPYHMLCV